MQAVAGREVERWVLRGDAGGERGDGGPVGLLGAVDDKVSDAGGGECGEDRRDVRGERRGSEVVVRVAEGHNVAEAARRSGEVRLREGADALADGGETVATRGGEVSEELEGGERVGVAGGNLGGSGTAEKLGEADDEAAHEGRVGIGVESE